MELGPRRRRLEETVSLSAGQEGKSFALGRALEDEISRLGRHRRRVGDVSCPAVDPGFPKGPIKQAEIGMLDHGLPEGAEHPAAVLFVAGADARGFEELLEHRRRAGHALLRDKSRRALRRHDQRRGPAGLVQGRRLERDRQDLAFARDG